MKSRDLALECGIKAADGWDIACRRFHHFRRMGDHDLTRHEIAALRPLFLAARPAPRATMVLAKITRPDLIKSPELEMTFLEEASTMNESDLARIADPMSEAMTVKQVAEALGCDDETVRRHVRSMWPNIFENGKTTYLDAGMVLYVKNKLAESGRNDLRNVAEVKNIHTELEMKQKAAEVLGWLSSEADRLRSELAQAAPKVEAFDRFLDASGSLCISDVAKQLKHQPLKFFDELQEAGFIFKRGREWLPVQYYIDAGYFEVKTRTFGDPPNEKITRQTRVTSKGIAALAKRFPVKESA